MTGLLPQACGETVNTEALNTRVVSAEGINQTVDNRMLDAPCAVWAIMKCSYDCMVAADLSKQSRGIIAV